jgi:ATP-dependent DNA helicase RecQ
VSRSTGQPHLLSLLKQVFGYTGFRPHQEEIIRDALAGRDVFALLPTGGGKSLCFQLPALARPGLTVVISPLIALMKDQVDQLCANGVAATFLNSSLSEKERKARWRGLHQGEFKLLYLSPERLMIGEGSLFDALRQWNVQQVAVDEAHCISEWGHDFRPEYRQLSLLREQFTELPFMALTATATTRVRDDIIRQLRLKDPSVHVASFNRPNLTYRVIPKSQAYRQVLDFVKARPKESGIVYCFSRASADSLAAKLAQDGVKSLAYHAGLTGKERSANQDSFLRDEVRVVCATVAFGMGINKPNVRFVIHHDLPKNIEGYYQETGRAGRDGLPGECLLLYSPGDVAKQTAFIAEKTDLEEQRIAREQLQQISHYADSSECRRAGLLGYFGEVYPQANCGTCDNCLSPRSTWDGTVAAQKFLSCVFRIRQKSGFGTGFNHVIAVLTGSESEKVIQWGHDKLSTYGIGADLSRNEWASIGRELVRLGYLRQTSEQFSVLEMTPDGMAALKDRRTITLTKPMERSRPKAERVGDIDCDELLFEKLRILRKSQADSLGVPPYIVFGDNSLRLMARELPTTDEEFLTISGVGERKLRDYGEAFLTEIREHLRYNPRG